MDPHTYEDALGDALESLLAAGSDSLEDLADGLNRLGLQPLNGPASWNADALGRELSRLAA